MPSWITTGPLEQVNDTKELNQVQLRLPARAKLVDNSVDDSGMISWIAEPNLLGYPSPVDAAPGRHRPSTGSPQVFPHRPLRGWRPQQDILHGHSQAKSPSDRSPEGWKGFRDPARVKCKRNTEKGQDQDHLTGQRKFRRAGRHCQEFGFRNLRS